VTRPVAAPEPFEVAAWWGSSPSLRILEELELVARASGRAVEVVVTPFTPPPALAHDAAGRPVVLLQGDTFKVTSRCQLHAVAQEALRRRLEGYGEEGEVFDA
jgi:hypothetical protein